MKREGEKKERVLRRGIKTGVLKPRQPMDDANLVTNVTMTRERERERV